MQSWYSVALSNKTFGSISKKAGKDQTFSCKGAFKNYVDKILDFLTPPPGEQFYLIGLIK